MCWNLMYFFDSNSFLMNLMVEFHDFIMMILIMILMMIFYLMLMMLLNKFIDLMILHNHVMELIWTLIPIVLLFFLAIPSLKILYLFEEMMVPFLSIKILGHQWYWSYEYSDFINLTFDSFMNIEYEDKIFRLLDVDNRLILPNNFKVRGLVSSVDVIHSWAMPSLGLKIDAIPGRINQVIMLINRPGLYYGQCSEICGLNHSFMPIVLESLSIKKFLKWLESLNF